MCSSLEFSFLLATFETTLVLAMLVREGVNKMRYYVNTNAQANGDHEVHQETDCPTPAEPKNRQYLGDFSSCAPAVREAKKFYSTANGCAYCSPSCHTT